MKTIITFLLVVLVSCASQDKEKKHLKVDNITPPLEIIIGDDNSDSKTINRNIKYLIKDGNVRIIIRDWFYNDGDPIDPILYEYNKNNYVLMVGTKSPFFPTKSEYIREQTITFPRNYIKDNSIISIYNKDIEECIWSRSIK